MKLRWLLFVCVVVVLTMGASPEISTGSGKTVNKIGITPQPISLSQRVEGTRAIDRCKYAHMKRPKDTLAKEASFEAVYPDYSVQAHVTDTLRRCDALKTLWGKSFSGEELQAEINRMVRDSLMPDRLQERFDALGNDPHLIAECMARPILAANKISELFSTDERFQGEVKKRAATEWAEVASADDLGSVSGAVTESEWVLATDSKAVAGKNPEPVEGPVYLDHEGWEKLKESLPDRLGLSTDVQVKSGMVGKLQENDFSYYGIVVKEVTDTSVVIDRVVWKKVDFTLWWQNNKGKYVASVSEPEYTYSLPSTYMTNRTMLADAGSWVPVTTTGAPSARYEHVAVWTGSGMIVWGGYDGSTYFNTGKIYDPATDSWSAMTTPSSLLGRRAFAGTWQSGDSKFYMWGGYGGANFNTGGIYNPSTDSWKETCSTSGDPCHVPDWRHYCTMIPYAYYANATIWGGLDSSGDKRTGAGLFNGSDTTWEATDTADPDCPSPRYGHTAVSLYGWGNYVYRTMVVWGGDGRLNTGGRLRLELNTSNPNDWWLPVTTTNAPAGRQNHAAIGIHRTFPDHDLMLIWGGYTWGADLWNNEGGVYDVVSDSWSLMTTTGAPDGRQNPTAVWTGHEMIVWGGDRTSSVYNTGGRYDWTTDAWQATDTSDPDTPSARTDHTAVWADEGMIVWGGTDLTNAKRNGAMYISCWRAPNVSGGGLTAADADSCEATGISVTWDTDATNWGDYGYTDERSYTVNRDGTPLVSGGCSGSLPYGTGSCTDDTAVTGTSYTYSVTFTNSCGAEATTGSSSATDITSTQPTVTATCTAEDSDGCTANSGITITWPQDPGGGWNDNGVGSRAYRVWRWDSIFGTWKSLGSSAIAYGTTTYDDTSTVSGYYYKYKVRYINGCGKKDYTADTGLVQDVTASDPTVTQSVTATDASACGYTGITITWPKDPDNWGDSGTGDRYYRVRRSTDGANFNPIGSDIPYPTNSYTDTGASHDQLYYYQVRYKNGCGNNYYTDSGNDSATDESSSAPAVTTNSDSTDPDKCDDGGIVITWNKDPDDWGDGGEGTRTYDVLRDGSPLAAGTGVAYGTTTFTDTTGVNGTAYTYSVRYNNGCSLSTTTTGTSSKDRPVTPAASANNSTATDLNSCSATGVKITWDADLSSWGDGGVGPHTYEVLRDGFSLDSGISYGTTEYTDTTGTANTSYRYKVRYYNCGGLYYETTGVDAADVVDNTPCSVVSGSVRLTNADPNVQIDWDAVTCGDFKNYIVYATDDPSAPFPVQWSPLSSPTSNTAMDTLASTYKYYRVVTVDNCDNQSN